MKSNYLSLPDRTRPAGEVDSYPGSSGGLGPLISGHPRRPLGRRVWLLVVLPGLAAVSFLLAYGLWRGYYGYTRYGMVAAVRWSRPWLTLGLAAGALGLIWLFRWWQASRRAVALHQGGVRLDPGGRREQSLAWEDLSALKVENTRRHFLGLTVDRRLRATLVPQVGAPIPLDQRYRNLDAFLHGVKEHFFPHIYPELARAFRSGESLQFGPLLVNEGGLRLRGQTIPWGKVSQLELESGFLVIHRSGGRQLRLAAGRIPNLEVLLQILHEGGPHETISKEKHRHGSLTSS